MQAIETFATVTDEHHVVLDDALPPFATNRVRVLVLLPGIENDAENGEPNEAQWLRAATNNSAFDFLNDEEDIYSVRDGEPFNG